MQLTFFEHPILNSPYAFPARHWELDADGQPTNVLIESRRRPLCQYDLRHLPPRDQ